jgi:hypothetical protein
MFAMGSRTLTRNGKAKHSFFGQTLFQRYAQEGKRSSAYYYRRRYLEPLLHAHKQTFVQRVQHQAIVRKYKT